MASSGNYGNINRTNMDGVYASVTVGTTAVELKVGGSALEGRDYLIIQPKGNGVYYGFDSSVTTSNGVQLFKNQTMKIQITDNIQIFAIVGSGTVDVRVQELS